MYIKYQIVYWIRMSLVDMPFKYIWFLDSLLYFRKLSHLLYGISHCIWWCYLTFFSVPTFPVNWQLALEFCWETKLYYFFLVEAASRAVMCFSYIKNTSDVLSFMWSGIDEHRTDHEFANYGLWAKSDPLLL